MGFKFHPTVQGFLPCDRMAWPLTRWPPSTSLQAACHLPQRACGHGGISSGRRCGGGLRLQNSDPMLLEDLAID